MGAEFHLEKIASDLASQVGQRGVVRDDAQVAGKFEDVLGKLVSEVDSLQKESAQTLEGFAEGRVDDVHDVMMAMTRADLSFRMMLEVRNKLVEAYQEVMRTQV